jgi:23S rRNA (guanosine2251-2'-O)-methyltransferase
MKNRNNNQQQSYWLYGKHPVMMAIANPRRKIKRVICTLNSQNFLTDKLSDVELKKLNVETITPDKIDRIIGSRENVTHQGIAVEVEPLPEIDIKDLLDAKIIVALDKITDPHNIGAIMRSAAAFGASALITQEKNSPPENATIAKISAGTIEIVPYLRPSSLWITMEKLKEEGFIVVGLDGNSNKNISDINKARKIILVVGSEGSGLSDSIIERCDEIVKININGSVESLNASVATAVALYELTK